MVLPLQLVEHVQPFLGLLQALGIDLHVFGLCGQLVGQVLQFDAATFHPFRQFSGGGVDILQGMQPVVGVAEQGDDAALVLVEEGFGLVERVLDVLGVGQRLRFLFQLLLLPGAQGGPVELFPLELEVILLGLVPLQFFAGQTQLFLRLLVAAVECAVTVQFFRVSGQDVHHVPLEILLVEQQVLVLRMNVDEFAAQLFELGYLGRCVVDEGAALARGHDFAADDAFVAVEVKIVGDEEFFQPVSGQGETCLHGAAPCRVFDGAAVGALSQQQADGAQDDRLSGTGLAGDDGETVAERDVLPVDKCVVLYGE